MGSRIRFIGAGNIVKAILSGVEKSGLYAPGEIGIFDVSKAVREEFSKKGYEVFASGAELAKDAPVLVMAVTPQVIGKVADSIKESFSENTVILSLAAGIGIDWYQERFGKNCKVVRCMPTLTAQEGAGSFAVTISDTMKDTEWEQVDHFLSSCGIVEKIPEALMTEVVAWNGSAPGYFYHMANVAVEEAVRMGFDEKTALRLFAQTMKGSAQTLLCEGADRKELEGKLRLAGGTTVAALEKMEELGFDRCIEEGLRACVQRCRELGKL